MSRIADHRCDVLVVGGGVGGVAAALAAARRGATVSLVEENSWVGGQLTSQAVPPDEHPWIEQFGCTASYRAFRTAVRDHYRAFYPLTERALRDPALNIGNATVSRICHEPAVSHLVLRAMLSPWQARGLITVVTLARVRSVQVDGDAVGPMTFDDLADGGTFTVDAPYVLDATETGELLALAGVEHVTGAESHADTGEPHAPAVADPANMQAVSWCFAVDHRAGEDHTIDRPAEYARWREFRPDFWPDKYLSFTYPEPRTLEPRTTYLDPNNDTADDVIIADQSRVTSGSNLWVYRRALWRHHLGPGAAASDIVLVNWPMTDYIGGPIFGGTPEENDRHAQSARELSQSLLYWLQTEAPRPDGGTGWPGLRLRGDVVGTADGLAMAPYIRESRRIRAQYTVTEQDLSHAERGDHGAVSYKDSVGIGAYRIDLHPSTGGDNFIDIASCPFQIPLGALLPLRVANLLPAAKNIGTTHITNGCYRLHPVEWNVGEAAGALAAMCVARGVAPHAVGESAALTADLQAELERHGVELAWPQVGAY
ncbi:FAD-dependent oxidoreductase [Jiangella sp. DSM 45060]|uniref:FAD-dependent oxidoreductase n=1 Tax=Jiangella sp. DSM 45060 TaxID=1798224 RepID=UPI00087C06EF|nr:FAD-dependent oxidoreductase [Jiangella sp. DSM 45060]SDS87999.1 FAD dependent oxidoreductase [Jiangella sp. DSM 45060]